MYVALKIETNSIPAGNQGIEKTVLVLTHEVMFHTPILVSDGFFFLKQLLYVSTGGKKKIKIKNGT